ncbi:MAG: pyridoxal phosphate-dependent aminotransferase [Alphaproteobacteria bacterium]|nr:pyridoxal phosphate-dependent aminotransferase [Alphaproteobacteria bacterium]
MPPIRATLEHIESSRIREVSDIGMKMEGVTPLWFGESDMTTPDFVRDAATASLNSGETFYTSNAGIPELRQALARYESGLRGREIGAERIVVTISGMTAIMLAMETFVGAGDNAIVHTPIWPNCIQTVRIMGAEARLIGLEHGPEGWTLDLDALFAMTDERTRAIFINSPSNPTGWMMSAEDQARLLEFARSRGIWIIADEVYTRIAYESARAPSFLDIARPDDPLVVVNSFSKNWCMTGWRLGWMVAPEPLVETITKLVEFNFSCVPVFIQRAGIAALEQGEDFVAETQALYRRNRDMVYQRLAGIPGVHMANPPGAFYAFIAVDGMEDSLAVAKRILMDQKVGLAPGSAFGPGGEGHLRLCFAVQSDKLSSALNRLAKSLEGGVV